MVRSLLLCSVLYAYFGTQCAEYLYPVAQLANERICVMYQKNAAHIELWLWDARTGNATPGLFTRYTPAGLRILPNGNDISFIDHGLIKVKYANNSIPQILALDKPLSNITVLNWIDNNTCYTHAKQGDCFGFYAINTQGNVATILHNNDHDFLYPQKIGPDFYCIEKYKNTRCFKSQYRIMKLSENDRVEKIFDFGSHAVAFFTMVSDTQGFVIEHPQSIKEKKKAVVFSYHHIFKEDEQWKTKELFSFTIPSALLIGSERLYESLLPLLPRNIGDRIYFISQTEPGNLGLFTYNLMTDTIQKITGPLNEYFFVPIQTSFGIYCGGRLQQDTVAMELGLEGQCHIKLKEIQVFT